MIKAIITDLDGVIRHFPTNRNEEYEKQYGLPQGTLVKSAFEHSDLNKVIKGEISDEEWRMIIAFRVQKFAPLEDCKQLIKEWSSFPGLINHNVLDLFLKYRKEGSVLVLLTNATDKLDINLQTHSIHDNFDLIINSSKIGKIKPNPDIFHFTLKKIGVQPSEAVFIDDSLKNIEAAQKIGIKSHLYSCITKLEKFLSENW